MTRTLKCADCSASFPRTQHKRAFCSTACKQAYHNRMAKRGKTLVPLAMAWRSDRQGEVGQRAFAEFCRGIGEAIAEDKAAGRIAPKAFIGRQYALWLKP